jgi:hypothetical protein
MTHYGLFSATPWIAIAHHFNGDGRRGGRGRAVGCEERSMRGAQGVFEQGFTRMFCYPHTHIDSLVAHLENVPEFGSEKELRKEINEMMTQGATQLELSEKGS